jgi:capsular exopolysaccharide synthesis family protein
MAESFRLLRSNIRFASPDRPLKSIMVTSPGAGEGKTTTAVNLAVALATNGLNVILVDMDLRKPSVGKIFGLKRDRGLTNVVLGDLPIEEALQDTKVENLRVLLGGPLPPNPPEFLDSERCRAVINQLKQMADFLVIDTPPASFLTDGMILASQVDGVLVVANPRRTTRHALRRVVEQLLLAKGNILGVCLNRMQPGGREGYYYYYSYYYGYYHYYGDNGSKRGSKKSDAKGIKGFLKRLPGLAGKEARSGSEPSEQTESGEDSS